jgi:hypothetical protein
MTCKNHPAVEATVHCAGCAEPFCPNCSLELGGKYYCGSCKVLALGNRQLVIPEMMHDAPAAKGLLASAVLGLFCVGFILGPRAIFKALEARRQINEDPSLLGWGRTNAALVIGTIVTVLSVWNIVSRVTNHPHP